MTRKQLILPALVFVGIGCTLGNQWYLNRCNRSEGEKCFDSIQVGTRLDEVKTQLENSGFKRIRPVVGHLFDGGTPQPPFSYSYGSSPNSEGRYVYDDAETWVWFEIENGRIANKERSMPESAIRRSWQRTIDGTIEFLSEIR